ncbi:MAG: TRAP transporter small permease [Desulfovibrionales bacterium]|nr:TRAP transporter small permease [Desulfovibrionales bacterium]
MQSVDKMLQRVSGVMRVAACLSVLAMVLVTVTDITGRVQRSPIFGSEEIVAFLGVLALGLGLPYAHAHRSHIGVEVFVQLLSMRVRRVLKLFRETMSVFFFALVTTMMTAYARDKQLSGEVSLNLGLPEYVLVYVLAGCFAVTTLVMLYDLIRFVLEWRRS